MSVSDLPIREEIEERFKWDLTVIYKDDKAWEEEFKEVEDKSDKMRSYQGRLGDSAVNLLEGLNLDAYLSRLLDKLYNYAARKNDQDTTNNYYQGLFSRVQGLYSKVVSATSFIMPEIIQIPTTKLRLFLKEEEKLKLYRHYLADIMRQQEYYLSPKEERIIALTEEMAQGPQNIYSMINNADIDFPVIEDENGQEIKLTHGRYIDLLKRDNRRVRRDAFKGYYSTYGELKNTIATTLNTNIKKNIFYVRARGYDNSLEAALDSNNIPVEVYNNLLKTVKGNLEAMYDYIDLRKEALNLDELHMYDLYTPIVKEVKMEIDYSEAQGIILKALKPLGEDYLKVIKEAFNAGWIDIYENKGKRSGAYSASCYDAHPYILLNYNNGIDDLFTLAHELGHAMHSYYSNKEQPYIYSNYSIFVAEVASTVNEALLMQYLLNNTEDKLKKKYILNHYLEQFRGTVYRQSMFAKFEREIHQRAESGQPLTEELLSEIYHGLNKKYYGDQIIIDKEIDIEWARIPHFYYNFYVYQYATGFSAAIALSQKILQKGEIAVGRYLDFLKSGSADYPINLLKRAGVDMRTELPIQNALTIFTNLVERMKGLI